MIYDIFVNCNWVDTRWQKYSTVQYTCTHKQYTEQHNQLTGKSAGRAPSLRVLPWHLPRNWGKSKEKPQSG